jgi:Outer membrane lipoprotein carrier protein LolA-like
LKLNAPYLISTGQFMRLWISSLFAVGLTLAGVSLGAAEPPPAHPTASAPKDARGLFTAMASIPGLEAKFREEKKLALLRAPLVSEGRLYYKRGGYLARVTEKPSPASVRITPSTLEVNNGSGFQQVDLTGRADIKLFVESFARVLAGDYEALASVYEINFQSLPGEAARWRLSLVPKIGNLVHLVKSLELEGTGFGVELIRVNETKGDSTTTRVELVSAARSYSAEEQQRYFGAGTTTP